MQNSFDQVPSINQLFHKVVNDRVQQTIVNKISSDGWMKEVTILDDLSANVIVIDTTDQFCE